MQQINDMISAWLLASILKSLMLKHYRSLDAWASSLFAWQIKKYLITPNPTKTGCFYRKFQFLSIDFYKFGAKHHQLSVYAFKGGIYQNMNDIW